MRSRLPLLLALSTPSLAAIRYPSGLIIQLLSGPDACPRPTRAHDTISVHYTGTLQSDGSQFDSSYTHNKPFTFTVGVGEVIQGWDQGLLGWCEGQKKRLIIPAELGYGNRGAGGGKIPGGATLVFETELLEIVREGGKEEGVLPTGEYVPDEEVEVVKGEKMGVGVSDKEGLLAGNETVAGIVPGNGNAPKDGEPKEAQCDLLGPFALLVQGALGLLAVLTLVYKRWREVHKRPWKIFLFDVSKQLLGSMLTHVINLAMSMLGSVDVANAAAHVAATGAAESHGKTPNPCSFYLLNLGIDTTLGVPVLYVLLKILHALFLHTPLANPPESIKSGNYDTPPRLSWYLKQLLIYCIGLSFMKLFVFFLFLAMPFLPWIGDWALRWTEGNEALQIVFAMFLFPLAMNAVQYWIIDNFIMDKKGGDENEQKYSRVGAGEDDDEADEERRRMMDDEEDGVDELGRAKNLEVRENEVVRESPLRAVDPTPMDAGGEGSRR
ncbi:Putative FKBP-type peptidyl-prolyl cis-trans isomerase domain-containing protein [Septoria linicola]|uniref:peptidylprolyl isomerase n=1 Tax=Septoria linicola TaxID=215465 RepID=A0A9Q9AUA9_9PEZI|nr:putative FKBP-type peptidyl-prolyl cis-trans isomerase domain-containing protein [Septoria linicola]USW55972.1 Putative FKBP-type peptidyl-prolyl cis-trans isomerase domain-containing protein [Septoria linicola]